MKFASIIASTALFMAFANAQETAGPRTSSEGTSLQEQLENIKQELMDDESSVRVLAAAECTDFQDATVALTGVGNEDVCPPLGGLTGCTPMSKSSTLLDSASENYNEACGCVEAQKIVISTNEANIKSATEEDNRNEENRDKEQKDYEDMVARYETSGAIADMDRAIEVLKEIQSHIGADGQLTTNLLQTAIKSLSKIQGGQHLSALLEVAAERANAYTALNSEEEHNKDMAPHGNKLNEIINDLIEYIEDAKKNIENMVATEKAEFEAAEDFYQSEHTRLMEEIAGFQANLADGHEKKNMCEQGMGNAATEHGTIFQNAKDGHASFQAYIADLEHEKNALNRVFEILDENHSTTARAVEEANEHHNHNTHLYDLDPGYEKAELTGQAYLTHWLIQSEKIDQPVGLCGVVDTGAGNKYVSAPEGQEWVPYAFDGRKSTGCGGSCNGGVGVDLGSHFFSQTQPTMAGQGMCNPGYGSHQAAFMLTHIYNAGEEDVTMRLDTGADDGYIVYLNKGEVSKYLNNCRCYDLSTGQHSNLVLKPGINELVVKVGENGGHWGFVAKANVPDGADIYAVWPGTKTYAELHQK